MKFLEPLRQKITAKKRHIVLPEGEDPRICGAAFRASIEGLAQITLIGNPDKITHVVENEPLQIIYPRYAKKFEHYCETYAEIRARENLNPDQVREIMGEPVNFAAMMVRMGDADGTLGGAVNSTAKTMRAAFRIIGLAENVTTASSFFIMQMREPINGDEVLLFADCALVIDPDSDQLAQIASATANSMVQLLGGVPKIAMLSFSTQGSASHSEVDKVSQATNILRKLRPDLQVDGEIQLDAAIVPAVNRKKMTNSMTNGEANILVFPSLEAGNIGYKIAQRIGGAKAIGPVMQGFAKPANDLSRGCSEDDVYQMITLTAAQV